MTKRKQAKSANDNQITKNVRYFIIEADDLSKYGSQIGADKAEAEKMLAEAGDSIGNLVVVRGEVINPTFKLD